ncbi:unnamed protein product [Phytophthora lilii]|uniref:Unnamed protein product n=1 Tax=Phytophthora lilii TaxID=2077276 RepID=A0A9W6U2X6_9STRA|nr:unnamed protein product [Phytophthora lilii]
MADASVANDASRKRKRQRRKHRKAKGQSPTPQQGHYADPLSPIASTPMKRQHTKAAENSKSIKAKHAPPADARDTNVPKSKEEEKFFSPRKLLKEYDDEDKQQEPRAKKARTKLNYDAAESPDGKQGQEQEEEETSASADASASEDANDELFSPALKPPKASRSTSVSPPNARVRLESKFANTSAQSEEKMEDEESAEETVHTIDMADAEEHEDEDATPPEQEFNPYAKWHCTFLLAMTKCTRLTLLCLAGQVNNGIPIETWYDDEADAELLNLLPFLESLMDVDDVRPIVERQFQIQKLIDATPDEIV